MSVLTKEQQAALRRLYDQPNQRTPAAVADIHNLLDTCEEQRERIDDAFKMGERLLVVIAKLRANDGRNEEAEEFPAMTWQEAVDELAEIKTILLGVES